MKGILLVNKPVGWTSFDVVNYVRRMVAQAENKKPKSIKVGHSGTLDPFASGLLILLIGKSYTKRAGELSKLDKTYELTMRLGETSSTGDPEGDIKVVSKAKPSLKQIEAALTKFTGEIMQTPPAYSAIKVNGKRAYKLARAGQVVELKPRKVTVHKLSKISYAYPDLKLLAEVSSGTYIRSLVEDIGERLGSGAYTTKLERQKVGNFKLSNAYEVNDLNTGSIEQSIESFPITK